MTWPELLSKFSKPLLLFIASLYLVIGVFVYIQAPIGSDINFPGFTFQKGSLGTYEQDLKNKLIRLEDKYNKLAVNNAKVVSSYDEKQKEVLHLQNSSNILKSNISLKENELKSLKSKIGTKADISLLNETIESLNEETRKLSREHYNETINLEKKIQNTKSVLFNVCNFVFYHNLMLPSKNDPKLKTSLIDIFNKSCSNNSDGS